MAGAVSALPKFQFLSAAGAPLAGGTLEAYIAGSTTHVNTYQDSALTTLNTWPITLDAAGECLMWLDDTKLYKFVLKNAAGAQQWSIDNVPAGEGSVSVLNQAATGHFFAQDGAKVQRLNDRVLIGGASDNDGRYPNGVRDWLTNLQQSWGLNDGAIVSSQAAVLNSTNNSAGVAFLAGAQSLYFTSAGTNAIANSAYVVNNHASLNTLGWAFYGEAHKTTAASGNIYAMELDTRSTVATGTATPYQQGTVNALQLASGAGLSGVGQFDASTAIQIESNPVKFKVGINVGATAITGTDGVTGSGVAMALAKGHSLAWYTSDGAQKATIASQVTTAGGAVGIQFNDNGVQFTSSSSGTMGYFFRVNNAVNYPTLSPNTTGNAVVYGVGGTDTNIDLELLPQGTGLVRFGTYTAGAVATGGTIAIKDAAGNARQVLCA